MIAPFSKFYGRSWVSFGPMANHSPYFSAGWYQSQISADFQLTQQLTCCVHKYLDFYLKWSLQVPVFLSVFFSRWLTHCLSWAKNIIKPRCIYYVFVLRNAREKEDWAFELTPVKGRVGLLATSHVRTIWIYARIVIVTVKAFSWLSNTQEKYIKLSLNYISVHSLHSRTFQSLCSN